MIRRRVLRFFQVSLNLATLASCRLTRWTGKSKIQIHPKHLWAARAPLWLEYVKPGDKILDVGAGIGAHALKCVQEGAFVTAVEKPGGRNWKLLCALTAQQPAIRPWACDLEKPFPRTEGEQAFQGALLLDVLEHIANDTQLLREVARLLMPGGWLALTLPNRETNWKRRYRKYGMPWMADRDHKREYTWPEIEAQLAALGFTVVSGPHVIVYDTPLVGLIDLAGGISLTAYAWLQRRRAKWLQRRPQETSGWLCIARKDRPQP